MTDRKQKNLPPEERRARDAVRGLPRPRADSAFRARLKEQFATGAIPERSPTPGGRRAPRVRRRIAFVALAASVLFVLAVLVANRGAGPVPLATNGEGFVTVDGVRVAGDRMDEIGRLLTSGATVSLEGGAVLDIDYPGAMSWRLYTGTTATLPDAPGRWFGRNVESRLDLGELSILTREGFPGAGLVVSTAEGRVTISGTLVSVIRNDEVTCVCVQEGTARMESAGRDLGLIPPGQRWLLFRDGREPVTTEMAPPHRDHLLEFRGSVR